MAVSEERAHGHHRAIQCPELVAGIEADTLA
jgi:hypothetical protein